MSYLIFLVSFAVYRFTAFPALAPYRDAGELVSVIKTLGVAHPPGYPLYTIISGIICSLIPFGNYAQKVTTVSAIFMALFGVLLYKTALIILPETRKSALAAVCLGTAFSYQFWYLAVVQATNTMGVFFVIAGLYLLLSDKLNLAFLTFGLGTAVRMDIVLIYPAVIIYLLMKKRPVKDIIAAHFFSAAGFSVYLFLLVRAGTSPAINWGDPSTIERLTSSLMRRSHGGTLDLISAGYARGENFFVGLLYFVKHLFRDFFYVGIFLAVYGAWRVFRENKAIFWLLSAAFFTSGIVFIYLANMPPNPHALAILEAHFLLPGVFFSLFLVYGFAKIAPITGRFVGISAKLLLLGIFITNFSGNNKRNNFIMADYTGNLNRSLGENAIVVLREDVQVFSMWHQKFVTGKRPDIRPVAQGLAGSAWYQEMNSGNNVIYGRLSTPDEWSAFLSRNPGAYFTNDANVSGIRAKIFPSGLSNSVDESRKIESFALLNYLFVYRGDYRYGSYREFFSPDLIEDYARAWANAGFYYMSAGQYELAKRCYMVSLRMKDTLPMTAYHLAWCYHQVGNYQRALKYYEFAALKYERLLEKAREFRAMPDVVESIKKDAANVWLHKGVVNEKLGNDDIALANYSEATVLNPAFAMAYYNKFVIYWKRNDFKNSKINLELTLRFDPTNETAKMYLKRLMGG